MHQDDQNSDDIIKSNRNTSIWIAAVTLAILYFSTLYWYYPLVRTTNDKDSLQPFDWNNGTLYIGTHHKTGSAFGVQMRNILQQNHRNINLDQWVTSNILTKLKSEDAFIHMVRSPYHIIISGYNYHKSGQENLRKDIKNWVFDANPISCGGGCNSTEDLGLEKLQQRVDGILADIKNHGHGNILNHVSEEDGILYEACWEYCQIKNMLQVMKDSKGVENVMEIDMDEMMKNKEELRERLREFVGFDMDKMGKPDKKHVSRLSKEEKRNMLTSALNNEILRTIYGNLMKEMDITRWDSV